MKTYLASAVLAASALVGWSQVASGHAQTTTTVQFDREIVRILDDHCVMCHMDKGPAFPLMTYEQAYAARWQIRQDALDGHMAPWAAANGIGDFANDNSLTQREIDFLTSWAESFGPRNNGEVYTAVAAAPSAPKVVQAHFDVERWTLGRPDLLLALAPNMVKPKGDAVITRVIIDPGLTSQRWLRGLEYKPGDRRVVHAVSFAVQETGQWLGTWTPWSNSVTPPTTLAYRLPAASHIVAEIRYYGSAQALIDQGTVGLYFADSPSSREMANLVVEAAGAVPAATASRKASSTRTLDEDLHIIAVQPQLAPDLKSIEVNAKMPDGVRQVLLFAKDLPLQWPTSYVFTTPVALTKGTELSVIEHFSGAGASPVHATAVTFSAYRGAPLPTASSQVGAAAVPAQHFRLAGTVVSVDVGAERLVIRHGDIPGLMRAMTMSYEVGADEDLHRVAVGDEIQSDVVVNDTGTHLENIKVTRPSK